MAYYTCAWLAVEGENPYDLQLSQTLQERLDKTEPQPTFGPPFLLFLISPRAFLPFPAAVQVYLAINLVQILLCIYLWARILFPEQRWLYPLLLLAWPIGLPMLAILGIGQNTLWVLTGVTGWLWAIRQNHPNRAVLFLTLALTKYHLGALPVLLALIHATRSRSPAVPMALEAAVAAVVTFYRMVPARGLGSVLRKSVPSYPPIRGLCGNLEWLEVIYLWRLVFPGQRADQRRCHLRLGVPDLEKNRDWSVAVYHHVIFAVISLCNPTCLILRFRVDASRLSIRVGDLAD